MDLYLLPEVVTISNGTGPIIHRRRRISPKCRRRLVDDTIYQAIPTFDEHFLILLGMAQFPKLETPLRFPELVSELHINFADIKLGNPAAVKLLSFPFPRPFCLLPGPGTCFPCPRHFAIRTVLRVVIPPKIPPTITTLYHFVHNNPGIFM